MGGWLDEAALAGEREEVLQGILLAGGGGGGGGGGGDHEHRPVERIDDGMGWLLWLLLLLGARGWGRGRGRGADLGAPDLPGANPRLPARFGGGGVVIGGRRRG